MPAPRLRPVAEVFVGFGFFWGAWAVAAADVERSLRLSHGGFGLLLSAALGAGALANMVVGTLTERWGTTRALVAALAVWAVALGAGAAARGALLGAVLVAVFASAGAVDVVMNVAATAALADAPGRLVRLHGLFNAGAAIGAVVTGTALRAGGSWRWSWLGAAAVAALLAVRLRGVALPAGDPGGRSSLTGGIRALWRARLVVIAVAFAIGAMVEGGIETWGVLSLRERVGSGIVIGAGAAVTAYLVAASARVLLGPLVAARGAERGVQAGALLAAGGLVLLAVVDRPVLAAAGLVIAAAGISMCWPLLLAQAAAGRERPGEVVGGVSAVGYLGFVFGPSLVGAVAGTAGLRSGLLVLAAASVAVAAAPALRARLAGQDKR